MASALVFSALSAMPLACGGFARRPHAGESLGLPANVRHVELREVDDRPPLNLVARLGDPYPAMALAAAHDLGSEASVALSTVIESRLAELGFPATETRVHELGFQVYALIRSKEEAAQFVRAASSALLAPVTANEPGLAAVDQRLSLLRSRLWAGQAQAAVAMCSGELGVLSSARSKASGAHAISDELEGWRKRLHTTRAVGFAALGPSGVLEAAADAVAALEPWPSEHGPGDRWPARDVVGVEPADGERTVSIALRVADAGKSLEAARALGQLGSTLSARLAALEPAWTLERVVGTTRLRGACLRLDLAAPKGDPAPQPKEVARVVLLALEEAEQALQSSTTGAWALDDSVLSATDPRDAAAIAAWRGLSGRLEPGETRRFVSYATRPSEASARASANLEHALREVRATWNSAALETRGRVEFGQGKLWVLAASPCGTSTESKLDAGLSAIVVRALAARRSQPGEVTLEPWITPDGIGLLAHSPRRGPSENPLAHAERVGAALGRALVGTRLNGQDVALAREQLLAELGPDPKPGFWLLLEALAPNRPTLLEARGTWPSLSDAAAPEAETRRQLLISGPLRLAVIANANAAQITTASAAVERWLRPIQSGRARCPTLQSPAPRRGEITLQASPETATAGTAYVAVPIAASALFAGREPEWTQTLLNRQGGWLEQALRVPGLATAASARLLGGSHSAALIIEVSALDGRTRQAVAQVRGLLQRLARGAVTEQDLELARRSLDEKASMSGLNPRRRIVDLWRGSRETRTPNVASLRRFHASTFRPETQIVVYVNAKD